MMTGLLLWLLMAGQGQTPNPAWDVHIEDCENVDGFIECETKPWIMKREADSDNPPQPKHEATPPNGTVGTPQDDFNIPAHNQPYAYPHGGMGTLPYSWKNPKPAAPTAVVSEPITHECHAQPGWCCADPSVGAMTTCPAYIVSRSCKRKSDFLLKDSGGTWRCVNLGGMGK